MPNFNYDNMDRFGQGDFGYRAANEDALMEEILANINGTPLGQVLKRMASLPEIRKGKVLRMRQQITEGSYDEGEHLEAALDRVLEDLTA
jgi:hypothetical protein